VDFSSAYNIIKISSLNFRRYNHSVCLISHRVNHFILINTSRRRHSVAQLITEKAKFLNLATTTLEVNTTPGLTTTGIRGPYDWTLPNIVDDDVLLAKTPGIGKKTAQKLIVELKDRLTKLELIDTNNQTDA
jgi:hypothetical protein